MANLPNRSLFDGTDNPTTGQAKQMFGGLFDYLIGLFTQSGNKQDALNSLTTGTAINEAQSSAISAADTIDLTSTTGNFLHVVGNSRITTITLNPGAERVLVFDEVLLIVSSASLILPGGKDILTAPGDVLVFRGDSGGLVRCILYSQNRADASYKFMGYVSTTAPTDQRSGIFWINAAAMPTSFPVNIQYWDGAAWSGSINYTPNILDLWSNLSDNHGYYWFGGEWNLIDGVPDVSGFATQEQLQNVANSIPAAANNGILTIQVNGATVGAFSANQSGNTGINIVTGGGNFINSGQISVSTTQVINNTGKSEIWFGFIEINNVYNGTYPTYTASGGASIINLARYGAYNDSSYFSGFESIAVFMPNGAGLVKGSQGSAINFSRIQVG